MAPNDEFTTGSVSYPTPGKSRAEHRADAAERELRSEWAVEDGEFELRRRRRYAEMIEARAKSEAKQVSEINQMQSELADEADIAAFKALNSAMSWLRTAKMVKDDADRGNKRVQALHSHKRYQEFSELAAELRQGVSASVVSEAPVYTRHGTASWFRDLASVKAGAAHPDYREALDRIERHGRGVAHDVNARTAEGRHIRAALREASRQGAEFKDRSDAELRAMTTNVASGGSLVTPLYIVEDYAVYRQTTPTFMQQAVTTRDLPAYGMEISVQAITGPSGVGVQGSENTAPAQTLPTATYRSEPLSTFTGKVPASQQLHDRGGPIGFDSIIYAQLLEDLNASIDTAVITAALSGVTALTRSTFSIAGLFSDIGQMAASLETAAGTKLPPTHLVTTPTLGEWLMSQIAEGSGEPVFKPAAGSPSRSDGFLGFSPSGVGLWVDDNIPAVGDNDQIVMTSKTALFLYLGGPVFDVAVEPGAASLQVLYRTRCYAAPIVRYGAGIAAVTGAAYPTAVEWAA